MEIGCVWKWRRQTTGDTAKKWYLPLPSSFILWSNDNVLSPVCRQTALSVIPSSTFVPVGETRNQVISHHRLRCAQIPCKYFERSKAEGNTRRCPYLNKCQFAHLVDGQKYVFSPREIRRLKLERKPKRYTLLPTQRPLLASPGQR